ncbi:MAG: 4a-hydroxytetrahydrobiopterin dehydratase [Sterolibacterium sp.]|nr:4a-hydroxytetrahydrobiopterin dehydratase [Sterolibacterium sp.]
MTNTVCNLSTKACKPCEGGVPPLEQGEIKRLLRELEGWEQTDNEIAKAYRFKNYYETMAFVNATAWISHHENHHPDLEVGYRQCRVRYSTHAIGGLSENDFICAAKIDCMMMAES